MCPASLTIGLAAYGLYRLGSWACRAIAGSGEARATSAAVVQQVVTAAVSDGVERVANVIVRAVKA